MLSVSGYIPYCFVFPGTDEFFLSTDFNSRHFLVGALLSELRVSLGEIAEVQRVAIGVLRDLLAKHAFDDRYLQSVSHFIILLMSAFDSLSELSHLEILG